MDEGDFEDQSEGPESSQKAVSDRCDNEARRGLLSYAAQTLRDLTIVGVAAAIAPRTEVTLQKSPDDDCKEVAPESPREASVLTENAIMSNAWTFSSPRNHVFFLDQNMRVIGGEYFVAPSRQQFAECKKGNAEEVDCDTLQEWLNKRRRAAGDGEG